MPSRFLKRLLFAAVALSAALAIGACHSNSIGTSGSPSVGGASAGGTVGSPSSSGTVGSPGSGGTAGSPSSGGTVGNPSTGGTVGSPGTDGSRPYIFDWSIRDKLLPGFSDYTPIPDPGHDGSANSSVDHSLYSQLYASERPLGLMLQLDTNPINGSKDPNALKIVMSYVPRLDFVWADFEDSSRNAEMQKVIDQVRSNPNPDINKAYIGNYNDYPGATDYSYPYPSEANRNADSDFFLTSGENIADPSCYPYAYYTTHTQSSIWKSNVAPNPRAALFWAPLERFSVAKRNLPSGDLLIPWVARFIYWKGYSAPVPPREDVVAMIQHMRLRGADGYFRLESGVSNDANFKPDPTEESQDRQDMLDGWHSLDSIFDNPGTVHILNLSTDKTSGVQWSGVQVGDKVAILVSNLSDTTQRVALPTIPGLPAYSDWVPSNTHDLKFYEVPESGTSGTTTTDIMRRDTGPMRHPETSQVGP